MPPIRREMPECAAESADVNKKLADKRFYKYHRIYL
jgi:hypothetical protein